MISSYLFLCPLLPFAQAAETVLGAYIYSRHGDRSDKSHPPAILEDLGYQEVFTSGQYFRNQYVASNAPAKISGIASDLVKQSQLSVQAPVDTVLMTSAQAFLQGLYPPVGAQEANETLRNGTIIYAPLNGYQLIPIYTSDQGSGSEDQPWLQATSNCAKALASSNSYFSSQDYMDMLHKTDAFYKSLEPVVNGTFSADQTSFKNAYSIYDIVNVAYIHNSTIPAQNLLNNDVLFQLRTLGDHHEFALAYNASDTIRAVPGATLAAQVVDHLNQTIISGGNSKLGIQFGAYASFLSFFGLSQLPTANSDFYGIPDYASTMTFELFTTAPASPFPDAKDIQVRFLFHNGTISGTNTPIAYPLFGQKETTLPWSTFTNEMAKFSLPTTDAWCKACGNTNGTCSASGSSSSSSGTSSQPASSSSSGGGMSRAVAGVIGAMVTLGVILGVEALILLLAGLRLVRKKNMRRGSGSSTGQSPVGVK